MNKQNICVLGAGAWGTALAIHLGRVGHQVNLWSHSEAQANEMTLKSENARYLPGVPLPDNLKVFFDLEKALQKADAVLVVVPSHVFRQTLVHLSVLLKTARPHFAWATKGFEPETSAMLHEVASATLDEGLVFSVLSGPTFAAEVARGLPTAMVSASVDKNEACYWSNVFQSERFRMYTQSDVIGVEVGGAYKNIMAIATGLSDGLKLGANARAALVSRGVVEMGRFAKAMGAQSETMMGLAGMGDLVLTCTDDLSRNRRFGLNLAQPGASADKVMAEIGQVVEGVKAAKAVKKIADEKGLDLPIMEQVFAIVNGQVSPQEAVKALMARDVRAEKA